MTIRPNPPHKPSRGNPETDTTLPINIAVHNILLDAGLSTDIDSLTDIADIQTNYQSQIAGVRHNDFHTRFPRVLKTVSLKL